MPTGRVETRINTLLTAIEKKKKQLEQFPDSPHAPRWKEKLARYEASIDNLIKFGEETPPTGNPVGVRIGVPTAGG